MRIERLLTDLKGRSRSRNKEFEKAVYALKKLKPRYAEDILTDLDEEIFSRIDCLDCGNCCRSLGPRLIERDVKLLAGELGVKPGTFIKTRLKRDEDGDLVFQSMPCPFLGDDNYCSVYSVRPKACREYPHTSGKQAQSRLGLLVKNSEICPAVFLIMEELRKMKNLY